MSALFDPSNMSFTELFDLSNNDSNDYRCAEHPLFPNPAECKECAFLHYKKMHNVMSTPRTVSLDLQTNRANHDLTQAANPQMAGTSDLVTSRYPEPPSNESYPDLTPNHFQAGQSSAAPADTIKHFELQNRGLCRNLSRIAITPATRNRSGLSRCSQPPGNRVHHNPSQFPVPSQLATRYRRPAMSMAHRHLFKPRILRTTFFSNTPTPIAIDPMLLDDSTYSERFALSPTELPDGSAKHALPARQDRNPKGDPESEGMVETNLRPGEKIKASRTWKRVRDRIRKVLPPKSDNDSGKPYQCAFSGCPKRYGSYGAAARHYKAMHHQSNICPVCQRVFGTNEEVERHVQSRHPDKPTLPRRRLRMQSEHSQESTKEISVYFDTEAMNSNGPDSNPDDTDSSTGEDEQDPELCELCQGRHSRIGDEMIFCDDCGLGFHQLCYDIPVIPKGQWFCRECQAEEDRPPKVKRVKRVKEKVEEVLGLVDRRLRNGREEFRVRWAAPYGPWDDQWLPPENLRGLQHEVERLRRRDENTGTDKRTAPNKALQLKERSCRVTDMKGKPHEDSEEVEPLIRKSHRNRRKRTVK